MVGTFHLHLFSHLLHWELEDYSRPKILWTCQMVFCLHLQGWRTCWSGWARVEITAEAVVQQTLEKEEIQLFFLLFFFSPLRILHLTLLRLERLAYNGLEFWKEQKQQNNRTKNKNNENVENFLFEQRVCSKLLPFNLMYNTVSCNAHKESMFSKSKIIITWIPTTVFSFPIKNIIIYMSLKSMCYETRFLI